MIKEFRKAGRQYALTGTILDQDGPKPSKSHFSNLKLDVVLRNAREHFRAQPLKIRACRLSLTEILVTLISNGVPVKDSEFSELFFSTTQLFQNEEWQIRRLLYVLLNELPVKSSEAFIISAALLKDASESVAAHRGKATRRFANLLQSAMALQIDQHVKNSIVDKDPLISCSGLVYCESLLAMNPEHVKKWSPEILSAITKHTGVTQGLAIKIFLETKRNDTLALQKQLLSFLDEPSINHMGLHAQVTLVQQLEDLLNRTTDDDLQSILINHLQNYLLSCHEGLCFQSCKTMTSYIYSRYMKGAAPIMSTELLLKTLMMFLTNPSVLVRVGAMRCLYNLSSVNPMILGPHAGEIESVLSESNPTLAVLALSTLLNIGLEDSTDRLMASIVEISDQVPDNFRLDIILAIEKLCRSYPHKYITFLDYLGSQIKEDRSIECKELLVSTIENVANIVQESNLKALNILCDYIEDCEYEPLTGKVMTVIVTLASKTPDPKAYIYIIHNRLILENSHVRVCTIAALCDIAKLVPDSRSVIHGLLEKASEDSDEFVQHMCRIYSRALQSKGNVYDDESTAESDTEKDIKKAKLPSLVHHLNNLDQNGELATSKIDFDEIIKMTEIGDVKPKEIKRGVALQSKCTEPTTMSGPIMERAISTDVLNHIKPMITDFDLGQIAHMTPYEALTEKEAEYLVEVSKIFFTAPEAKNLAALELRLTNTLEDIDLREIVPRIRNAEVLGIKPIAELLHGESAVAYALLQVDGVKSCSYNIHFTFTTFENGADGIKDEYAVEPVVLSIIDRMSPTLMGRNEVAAAWAELENAKSPEIEYKYCMPDHAMIHKAVIEVARLSGLHIIEYEIDKLKNQNKGVVFMSGTLSQEKFVFAKVWAKNRLPSGTLVRIIWKCEDADLLEELVAAFKESTT